ncbi:hypothetical protein DFJ73DRAFT_758043 [Zopfochytrium polystomum]|nr:hypothetical protein DFJ73DRAFT_758043 [Zopfochytrium polystomum]
MLARFSIRWLLAAALLVLALQLIVGSHHALARPAPDEDYHPSNNNGDFTREEKIVRAETRNMMNSAKLQDMLFDRSKDKENENKRRRKEKAEAKKEEEKAHRKAGGRGK